MAGSARRAGWLPQSLEPKTATARPLHRSWQEGAHEGQEREKGKERERERAQDQSGQERDQGRDRGQRRQAASRKGRKRRGASTSVGGWLRLLRHCAPPWKPPGRMVLFVVLAAARQIGKKSRELRAPQRPPWKGRC
ncbi:unnamed protein product [Prorocentrum cordatum]|uniref:Uncharacterized protein n=1 Tax=Prorocentrum cordatum TaxID=2364126 RepID=A0ABN9W3H7_9DINO|nr:unnamed protein product [Polarella glacialis]